MSGSQHPPVRPDAPVAPAPPTPQDAGAGAAAPAVAFVTASHAVLFEAASARRCDACGDDLDVPPDDPPNDFAVGGSGLYLWSRGDEIRYEEPPLCASCATAIGVSALARWEIEEEEG